MMREGRWPAAERPPAAQPVSDYQRGLLEGQIDVLEHVLEALNAPGVDVDAVVRTLLKGAQRRAAERGVR